MKAFTCYFFFKNYKYDDEKFQYLKSADAVIMPSIHEPFGIVALEALASGTILLCSIVDGLAEFINDTVAINCGITPENITEAINTWNKMSSEEIENKIQLGMNHASKYSWLEIADRTHKEIYTE